MVNRSIAWPLSLICAWLSSVILPFHAKGEDSGEGNYLANVRPVFYARCVACHGALKQEAGLRLDSGRNLVRGSETGAVVNANEPGASVILQRVISQDLSVRMPPEGEPLHPEQIETLKQWISSGAKVPSDEQEESDPGSHWA
ncbi:MAG: hypothetical protein KGQ51_18550, partial [Planctomycetes bacterium]|nr:hypothetical protein [Planctomycetota bacterium]